MIGQLLGHYRVDERIGAGGMGVVYRAYDTRLERPVAIKLVSDPTASAEAAHRQLLSEARGASALNHPHICVVHEVVEGERCVFLVMEYVEGRTLGAIIPDGGLPPETVIRHGQAIASALDHAHDRGVLHRDLKSSNVMVTPAGAAKILDFGIARRTRTDPDEPTREVTDVDRAGIAGTLAYIAPEVLAGDSATTRSDIWSFGVLLYEMTAGTMPFAGRSTFELTAQILREPPRALPASVPPALSAIILRCLTKEPALRYARAGEIRAALEASGMETGVSAQPSLSRIRTAVGASIVAGGVLAAVWMGWRLFGPEPDAFGGPTPSRLTLLLSSDRRIVDPVLSPDGRLLAYVGEDEAGQYDLYLSQIPGSARIQLTSDDAVEGSPRFSPDGQRIAFTRRERGVPSVHVIATLGGTSVQVLASASEASWSPDGTRLAFVHRPGRDDPASLATALADGSSISVLFTAEPAHPFVRSTAWSADGQRIAFVRSFGGASSDVWTIPASGGTPDRLSDLAVGVFSAEPVFTPDGRRVILSSNRGGATNLWSVPLGDGEHVQLTAGPGPDVSPSIGADGVVAFLNSRWRSALVVVDTERGDSRTILTHSPYLWAPAVSPDGTMVAFSRSETDGLWQIWIAPLGAGTARQLTRDTSGAIYPRFTPDGASLTYHTWGQPYRIWRVSLAGGPPVAVTSENGVEEAWADTSPDGKWLAFVRVIGGVEQTFVAPVAGGEARLLTELPATAPRWSPDGTRIAFSHDRSFDRGISIVEADGRNPRRLTDTGGWPVWWADGTAIAYLVTGEQGNQEIRLFDLDGRALARRTWPRFVGTNHLIDVFRDGTRLVTTSAVHQSDEVWLLHR